LLPPLEVTLSTKASGIKRDHAPVDAKAVSTVGDGLTAA
jgi:hypothetical protein